MRVSTLSIGDELVSGRVIDTNVATIAQGLMSLGLQLQRHIIVGDREPDIMEALQELSRTSDAVIVTGGLGPTADDITAHAAARTTGRRLVVNEEAKQHVRTMSSHLPSLVVCPLNDKQTLIPTKTTLIPNPTGTACGFHLMYNSCFLFFLPGVPSEMQEMLQQSVFPFISERIPARRTILTSHVNIFGPCEAEVDEMLGGIANPGHGLRLGICVTYPWIRVTLQSEADTESAAQGQLQQARAEVVERLDQYIFSEGELTIDESVADLFVRCGLSLSLAESCTGGMIAERITSIAGSSRYFQEAGITYSNSSKHRQLAVDAEMLQTNGAVSSEVASAMAKGIRTATGSALGLAVTGIAGPDGGSDDKPVGTVFISLAAPDGCWTKRFQFNGTRHEIRVITTWTAIDWLRRYLLAHLPDLTTRK